MRETASGLCSGPDSESGSDVLVGEGTAQPTSRHEV